MSPLSGLKVFSHAWSKIAAELLRADPWKFENGSPKGVHKAITDLETGAAFSVMATLAEEKDGFVSRSDLWREWAESELALHGMSLQTLRETEALKEMGAYEKTEKRIKKEIDDLVVMLEHYGLFTELAGNRYQITQEGQKRFNELKG